LQKLLKSRLQIISEDDLCVRVNGFCIWTPSPNSPTILGASFVQETTPVTTCTAWRWRKRGWLKTVNIAGRQYLTQEAIDEFYRRATAGEFSQVSKVPTRKEARTGA
jgi:hypothetical protein